SATDARRPPTASPGAGCLAPGSGASSRLVRPRDSRTVPQRWPFSALRCPQGVMCCRLLLPILVENGPDLRPLDEGGQDGSHHETARPRWTSDPWAAGARRENAPEDRPRPADGRPRPPRGALV